MIVHHPYPNRWDERRAKLPGLPWMDWPWTALDCPGLGLDWPLDCPRQKSFHLNTQATHTRNKKSRHTSGPWTPHIQSSAAAFQLGCLPPPFYSLPALCVAGLGPVFFLPLGWGFCGYYSGYSGAGAAPLGEPPSSARRRVRVAVRVYHSQRSPERTAAASGGGVIAATAAAAADTAASALPPGMRTREGGRQAPQLALSGTVRVWFLSPLWSWAAEKLGAGMENRCA